MTFNATLTLSQTGRMGLVTSSFDYEGDNEAGAESHVCMGHLESLWEEMAKTMDHEEPAEDDTVFSATLSLSQDDVGGDVYTKLEMSPKLTMSDTQPVPSSYEAICFIAQVWLQMAGVIDDEGNVINEDAIENAMDLQVTASPTVH